MAAVQAAPLTEARGVPSPRRCGAIRFLEDAPAVRRLDCGNYDTCLDSADKLGWEGFSCHSCRYYEPITDEQRLHDVGALLQLFQVVSRTKP